MEHELKELPDNYRCDQCGMFFASTGEHHYFKQMEFFRAALEEIMIGFLSSKQMRIVAKKALREFE